MLNDYIEQELNDFVYRKNCFARKNDTVCNALNQKECDKCNFYKPRSKIKDNPYYAYSYSDSKKHRLDMEKRNIDESQVIWN